MGFDKVTRSLSLFGVELGKLKASGKPVSNVLSSIKAGITGISVETRNDIDCVKNFGVALSNGVQPSKAWAMTMKNATIGTQNLVRVQLKGAKTTSLQAKAIQNATTKLKEGSTATKAMAVAANILNAALNMLVSMVIAQAVQFIIQQFASLVNTYQEGIEKTKEYSNNIKSLEDSLSSLKTELKDNLSKLHELEKIKSPSLYQQDQIDKLRDYNQELERQLQLEEYKLRIEKSNANTTALQLWKEITTSKSTFDKLQWYDVLLPFMPSIEAGIENVSNLFQGNFLEQKQGDLEAYQKKLEEFQKFKEDYGSNKLDLTPVEFDDKSKELESSLKSYENTLMAYRNNMETIMLGLDPNDPKNKDAIKQATEFVESFDEVFKKVNNPNYGTFTGVYESVEFSEITTELNALAESGELTEKTFNDVKGVEKFKEALADVGVTDTEEIIRAIETAVDDSSTTIKSTAVPSVQKLTDAYEDLEKQIEKILDLQNKLSDAFEKVASGEVFTAEEAYNLVKDIPELYKYITPVEGGFSFSLDGLEAAYKSQNEELIAQIEENSKENQKVIDYYNEQKNKLDGLQPDTTASTGIRGFHALEADTKTSGYSEDMTALKQSADEASEIISQNNALINILNGSLESHSMKLSGINTQYETARDKIDNYNSHVETINKAISTLNENNALTYDEMAALVEISPALKSAFTEQGNGYYIAIDSLELLKEQSYTTRDSYIDDLIAMAEAEITSAEATKKAIGAKINSWDSYISYTAEIAEISAEISGWQDLIDKLTALKGKVYGTDSNSSSGTDTISDKLQQEIDYYDKIIQGIEAVADKRIEAIDKEIEAINEQKDALKEQNDERQRELDLIEAQNNLEKAKKQKVFVYKEGQGLIQVQDEKAVKEAQKELDDAQREIKEAEYDKQIDLLEQQSKATEEYRDTFSDMKSDIEDAIAVETAKTALGTDENGLLNLSESAINGIQNSLAKAVVSKENEDNKDNPHYKDVSVEDILRKLGSNATAEEFKAKVYDPMMRSFSPEKLYNVQGVSNNQYITNNSPTTFTATFNISGATDPNEVAKVVRTEITDLLQRTYNKIK